MTNKVVSLSIGELKFLPRPQPRWEGEVAFGSEQSAITISVYGAPPPSESEAQKIKNLERIYGQILPDILTHLGQLRSEATADQVGGRTEGLSDVFQLEAVKLTEDREFELSYVIEEWDDATWTVYLQGDEVVGAHISD